MQFNKVLNIDVIARIGNQTSCPELSIYENTHIRQSLEFSNHLRFENGYLDWVFFTANQRFINCKNTQYKALFMNNMLR